MTRLTLKEAAEMLRNQGFAIKWDESNDIEDFFSYFEHHYKPVILQESKTWAFRKDALRFLADDLLTIFDNA